jgi:hypothetical protein
VERLDNSALAKAQAVTFDIRERTERLSLIADWCDELRRELGHACNNVWDEPDYDRLRTQVARFKLACRGVRT